MRRVVLLLPLVFVLLGGGPRDHVEVLFLGSGGHHKPSERLNQLLPALVPRGIHITYTQDLADLNPEFLKPFDCIMVYANINHLPADREKALLDFVAGGKGFVPVHCASGCFGNSEAYIKLTGAQFKSHGTGTFRTRIAEPDHPVMKGFKGFESWDETYVHQKHNDDRTVLAYRDKEPWTWVRTHGKGRVFYTAWGHDQRTWGNPGFHDLLERGIRWASGDWAADARPKLKPLKFDEAEAPVYEPGRAKAHRRMQAPLTPEESIKHMVLPPGFELKLFAAEPDIVNPISMAWDARGRLWVVEAVDYPNDGQPSEKGRDRIKICEDTNGDGRADKFTVFADGLSLATSLVFARGGLIVLQAPQTLFLKDTDGDDRADVRRELFRGWRTYDTHAGPSNFRFGLDNWIWGTVGYSGFDGRVGRTRHAFGSGVVRFLPDGSALEFLGSTTNNTWGFGFTEDGEAFTSTANNNHSNYLGITNRAYEGVRGWNGKGAVRIRDHSRIHPITRSVRQVDWQGVYTAAAGSAIYTARVFPPDFWNRVALVCEPTAHLLHKCELQREGSGYVSRDGWNLMASDDVWTGPVGAEVGPDGAVWIADWYNFIVQHNAYAGTSKAGKGNAYRSPLRDRKHGRILRLVPKGAALDKPMRLDTASPAQLVAALKHPNMFWRTTAQRLLVERGKTDVVAALRALVEDKTVDTVGLNVGAIHALWTLKGLGATHGGGLDHPSAAVRKNAVRVLPTDVGAVLPLLEDPDAQVRREALLALAAMPPDESVGMRLFALLSKPENSRDRWIPDAAIAAAARNDGSFLNAVLVGSAGRADVAPVNLVPNPSFEELKDGKPLAWKIRHYSGSAKHRVAEGGRTGKVCLEISSEKGSDSSWHADVPVKQNTFYRLSAWIKTDEIRNKGRAFGALLNIHTMGQTVTQAVTGTHDWRQVDVVFNSGNYKTVSVNCLIGGWGQSMGTAWWDDVALHELGPAAGMDGVVHVVTRHYAAGAPVESVAGTLAALRRAEPALARAVLGGLVTGWPQGKAPALSDADRALLGTLKESLPENLRGQLVALSEKWGMKNVFDVDRVAIRRRLAEAVGDAGRPVGERTEAAIALLRLDDSEVSVALVLKPVTPQASPELAGGLLRALVQSSRAQTAEALMGRWEHLTSASKAASIDVLLRRVIWTRALLDAVEKDTVHRSDLSAQQWYVLSLHTDPEIAKRAGLVRGRIANPDRQKVIERFSGAAERKGDVAKGLKIFRDNCITCHAYGGEGGKVGPDLAGVRERSKAELLTDILDPNRTVEANYRFWNVVLTDGTTLSGRLDVETKTSIEIMDLMSTKHIIQRKEIKEMTPKSVSASIMAVGFEEMGEEDMADLLEFLTKPK